MEDGLIIYQPVLSACQRELEMYIENEEEYARALRLLEEMYQHGAPVDQRNLLKQAIIEYEDKLDNNQAAE